jgi:hypothetical protein
LTKWKALFEGRHDI